MSGSTRAAVYELCADELARALDNPVVAAAPDLLAALKQIYAWLLDTQGEFDPPGEWAHPLFKQSYELAYAALAKAEGR